MTNSEIRACYAQLRSAYRKVLKSLDSVPTEQLQLVYRGWFKMNWFERLFCDTGELLMERAFKFLLRKRLQPV